MIEIDKFRLYFNFSFDVTVLFLQGRGSDVISHFQGSFLYFLSHFLYLFLTKIENKDVG